MWIKALGAVLILAGCAWTGVSRCWELRRRVRLLEELADCVERIRMEVCRLREPLPQVLASLRQAAPELFPPAGAVPPGKAEAFYEVWERAALELPLGAEARRAFAALGAGLCAGDEPDRVVEQCALRLSELREKARREAAEKGRLSASLGLCVGVLLAIILA